MQSPLAIGDRVTRWSDGAPGVVTGLGLRGSIWVRWNSSGLTTVVSGNQVERA